MLFLLASCAFANARVQGDCMQGGHRVTVTGGLNSQSFAMQSFVNTTGGTPTSGCTVSVYITGSGGMLATLTANTQNTTANPFVADATGHWYFEAANGSFDITLSGAGIASPFTLGNIGAIDPQFIGGIAYADTFAGSDACIQIQNAITALPEAGGVVNAIGLHGTLPCSANPYGSTTKAVTLLLGSATYVTTAAWVVPNKSRLIGIGRGDSGALNSMVQANAVSFPASTAVVSLCSSGQTPCFGVEVELLSIDCNGVTGCIGGQNSYSQEKSWFSNVLVENNAGDGFLVNFGAQNSGPYSNLEVLPGISAVAGTTCYHMNVVMSIGVSAWRGLNGATCNANGYTSIPTNAIYLEGVAPGSVSNVHIEHFTNGITLGSGSGSVSDVIVTNVECGPDNATSVLIPSGSGTQNVTIAGVQNSTAASNVLVDQVNSVTMSATTAGLGFYATGYGSAGNQTILTSRQDIAINLQTALRVLKTLTVPGTNTGLDNASFCFGPGVPFCLYAHESNVSGVPGPVMKTQNLGLLIQNGQVSAGNVGGGLSLNGNGFNTDAAAGQVGAGMSSDMATFTARATTAAFTQWLDGVIKFYSDTGLTAGMQYTPTIRASIKTDGHLDSIAGFSFNGTSGFTGTKVAGSCTLTIQGGIITNVTGC